MDSTAPASTSVSASEPSLLAPRRRACSRRAGPGLWLLALCVGVLGVRCSGSRLSGGSEEGDLPLEQLVGLTLEPDTVTLDLSQAPPGATAQLRAIGEWPGGVRREVTSRAYWVLDNVKVGVFSDTGQPGLLTTTGTPGTSRVSASAGGQSASGTFLATRTQIVRDPSLGGMQVDAGQFAGKPEIDPARLPRIVYPYDRVLMPPNLGSLEVHWQKGNPAHTLFEIALKSRVYELRIYTRCAAVGGGCVYALGRELWNTLATANAGVEDAPAQLTVRGTDDAGTSVGTSTSQSVRFALEDLNGGVYYWSAVGDNNGIYRIDLESGKFEPFFTVKQAPADNNGDRTCIGCHALSHDGTKMNVVLGGGHVSDLIQIDVATRQVTMSKINTLAPAGAQRQYSNLQSYSADGSTFVSTLFGKMKLIDAKTGATLIPSINVGEVGPGTGATHPDWSRSGKYVAFTQFTGAYTPTGTGDPYDLFLKSGGIALLRWNGTGFDAPTTIVPIKEQQSSYYPSVSPDDAFVAFNRIDCPTGGAAACDHYDNPYARIALKAVGGSGALVELTGLNRRGPSDVDDALTNSWPKFSPFKKRTADGKTLLWVMFSSKRNYGLRKLDSAAAPKDRRPQLWMGAIVVGSDGLQADPSAPPFWLPSQDLTTNNHIAQWTERVIAVQ